MYIVSIPQIYQMIKKMYFYIIYEILETYKYEKDVMIQNDL